MARGDVHFFADWVKNVAGGAAAENLGSDVLKLGIADNGVTPTVSTSDPRWGSGGSTDFSAHQITPATSYTTGGPTLASVTWVRASGVVTLDAADVTIAQDAGGATNAYFGIIYDSSDAGKHAIAFVDLGGPVSLVAGSVNISWNASGIGTMTAT